MKAIVNLIPYPEEAFENNMYDSSLYPSSGVYYSNTTVMFVDKKGGFVYTIPLEIFKELSEEFHEKQTDILDKADTLDKDFILKLIAISLKPELLTQL